MTLDPINLYLGSFKWSYQVIRLTPVTLCNCNLHIYGSFDFHSEEPEFTPDWVCNKKVANLSKDDSIDRECRFVLFLLRYQVVLYSFGISSSISITRITTYDISNIDNIISSECKIGHISCLAWSRSNQ